jgi:hypothetical protein
MMNLFPILRSVTRTMRFVLFVALGVLPGDLGSQETARPRSTGARASGITFDSLRATPLRGAVVQFTGTDAAIAGRSFVATSDSSGRYRIDSLPEGRYIAGFLHPRLDSLGIDDFANEVRIKAGENLVTLATPSARTMLRITCRVAEGELNAKSLIVGHVRSSGSGSPLGHGSVQAWWTEPAEAPFSGFVRNRSTKVSTRADGWFGLCAVPGDLAILVQAAGLTDTSGVIPVRTRAGNVSYVQLTVGAAHRVVVPDSNSFGEARLADTLWRGSARLAGVVRDDRGVAIANAEVSVVGTGISVRSAANGRFAADSLPAGSQLVEVRAIGFEPNRITIDFDSAHPTDVTLSLPRRAVSLERVEVRATASEKSLQRLENRRLRGSTSGYFMLPEEIQRRPPDQSMARLIEGFPGVQVKCPYPHACTVEMYRPSSHISRSGRELCVPSLYIDGVLDRSQDFNFLDARHVLAIEVYPREIGRPVEFTDMHNNCGAVVVWTRR